MIKYQIGLKYKRKYTEIDMGLLVGRVPCNLNHKAGCFRFYDKCEGLLKFEKEILPVCGYWCQEHSNPGNETVFELEDR